MPAPLSPTKLFQCTACGATLPIRSEHAGRRCRCGRCGKVMVVPNPKECWQPPREKEPPNGRKPNAMHGQQYGLWGVDEAPSPAEIAANHPKYFPVYCRNCDTLMHATTAQVGSKLTCPDCGAMALVVEPPPKPSPKEALVPDGEEYQLDGPKMPIVEPKPETVSPPEHSRPKEEEKNYFIRHRPKRPRLPLLQGVGSMLRRTPVPTWGMGLSLTLTLVVPLIGGAYLPLGTINAFTAVCMLAAGCIIGSLWLGAASSLWLAILTESSEGNDRLHNPPEPIPYEWFGNAAYVVLGATVAGIPGMAVGKLVGQPELATGASWLLCFPVALLSMLELGTPMAVVSPRLFSSLWKKPGPWLLFYVESVLIVGGVVFASAGLASLSAWLVLLVAPLLIAASLLYFRLLGRLAWWLAESMSTSEEEIE